MREAEILKGAAQQVAYGLGSYGGATEFTTKQRKMLRTLFLAMLKYAPEDITSPPREGNSHNNIIFALNPETSQWAAIGVLDEIDQVEWELFGFVPESAGPWLKANFTPDVARQWSRFTPEKAATYMEMGWPTHVAASWEQFEPDEALEWKNCDITASAALAWKAVGVDVKEAPFVAKVSSWKTIKPAVLRKRWGDMLLEDIYNFITKGYTPAVAKKMFTTGCDTSKLKHVRGDFAVAGKTFKHFVQQAKVSPFEWSFPEKSSDMEEKDSDVVQVDFEVQAHGNMRRLTIKFSQTGRFMGAEDTRTYHGWRTIAEVDAVLSNPF